MEKQLNRRDLRTYPVQEFPCKTCPFEGEEPIWLPQERYVECLENLVTFDGQHLCHSAKNKAICRGGRTLQLRILCALKILPEATDEAFNQAINESLS